MVILVTAMHVQKTVLLIASVLGISSTLYCVNEGLNPGLGIASQTLVADFLRTNNTSSVQISQSLDFTPPSRGTPSSASTTSLGTRDDCGNWDIPLVTLVPSETSINDENVREQSTLALTGESHPVFWFYLPELPNNLTHVNFRLQNEDQTYVYRDQIEIKATNEAKLVGFRLPADQPALTSGVPYIWIVSVPCDPNEPAPSAEAWIERMGISSETSQLPPSEHVRNHGENGLLHEFISNLVWLRANQPDQYDYEWVDFLENINLQEISGETNIQFPAE